jgi:hypothetical protein
MKMNMEVKGSCEVANFPQRDFAGVWASASTGWAFYGQVATIRPITVAKPTWRS